MEANEPIKLDKTNERATPAFPEDQPAAPIQDTVNPPARPKGPNAIPIVLGLVALVLAAVVIAQERMNLTVDWSGLGPGAIIAIGALMVVVGAIGLVRRHDDG